MLGVIPKAFCFVLCAYYPPYLFENTMFNINRVQILCESTWHTIASEICCVLVDN
jgi:hypothetical protein